jgi:DNA-binding NarL/FixJ family response regulator
MQLIEAKDGKEATTETAQNPPDLVFMDIHLPDKNGLELTQQIKSRYPEAVVVVLSNSDVPEYQEAAYRSGASYFVSKDASMGDFLSLIERIMTTEMKSRSSSPQDEVQAVRRAQ